MREVAFAGRWESAPRAVASSDCGALRQGPHLLCADHDDAGAFWTTGRGRVEARAATSVRACGLSTELVSATAAAGGELRAAGAHCNRAGASSLLPVEKPSPARHS